MGIEQDIQQTKFRNDYQKGLVNLIYTHGFVTEKLKSIFSRSDITSQQYNILRILRGAGKPLSTLELRKRMLVKMSDTSRLVDRLILKDFVKKITCTKDKRLVDISITTAGLKLLTHLEKYNEEMDELLQPLTQEEVLMLNTLLDKIRTL
jgi:DNA-binding MarR family transcriptional regulator